jgi:hypothetical protein
MQGNMGKTPVFFGKAVKFLFLFADHLRISTVPRVRASMVVYGNVINTRFKENIEKKVSKSTRTQETRYAKDE